MATHLVPRWTAAQLARVKPFIFVLCLYPLLRWFWLGSQGQLTANPAHFLILSSGLWALVMLIVTLGVTPLRRLSGQPALTGLRRMLGLFSFFYTMLHVFGWALWEHDLLPSLMWQDILNRTFITVGTLATLPMIALALTSTRGWMRRLGSRWGRLHRSIYLIAILSVWHFWLVRTGKNDFLEPYVYAVVLGLLLGLRLIFRWHSKKRRRKG